MKQLVVESVEKSGTGCSSQEEHVLKRDTGRTQSFGNGCSSQEEHVLKQMVVATTSGATCCSSQEEHVLKRCFWARFLRCFALLLARGACIETALCSWVCSRAKLLLARGACIETTGLLLLYVPSCCSSQEEHVLKLILFAVEDQQQSCCSSQEEHVLKQKMTAIHFTGDGCSSQEEHVLKRWDVLTDRFPLCVAPRKRSMY